MLRGLDTSDMLAATPLGVLRQGGCPPGPVRQATIQRADCSGKRTRPPGKGVWRALRSDQRAISDVEARSGAKLGLVICGG